MEGIEVYLVRHAEAKSAMEDPEQGLTEKGFDDIGKVAAFAEKAGVKVRRIFHSNKKRARETAEVLARNLKPPLGASEEKGLSPLDDPGDWAQRLSDAEEPVMLVGHLPHLGKLASILLEEDKERGVLHFGPACLACLRKTVDKTWALAWMITPELL